MISSWDTLPIVRDTPTARIPSSRDAALSKAGIVSVLMIQAFW